MRMCRPCDGEHFRGHVHAEDLETMVGHEGRHSTWSATDIGNPSDVGSPDQLDERFEHRPVDGMLRHRVDLGAGELKIRPGSLVVDGSGGRHMVFAGHAARLGDRQPLETRRTGGRPAPNPGATWQCPDPELGPWNQSNRQHCFTLFGYMSEPHTQCRSGHRGLAIRADCGPGHIRGESRSSTHMVGDVTERDLGELFQSMPRRKEGNVKDNVAEEHVTTTRAPHAEERPVGLDVRRRGKNLPIAGCDGLRHPEGPSPSWGHLPGSPSILRALRALGDTALNAAGWVG